MYWLKTKVKHILYHNFTDREFSRFMKVRALTCQLGEMPNDKQMLSVCPQKTLNSIREVLQNEGKTLREVLQKDIEDATEVQEKRNQWKIKKRQQREKLSSVQEDCPNLSNHREEKRREDKIRVDKTTTTGVEVVYDHFSNNIHLITPAVKSCIDSYLVDTPIDWIKKAIDEGAKGNARSWKYIESVLKSWKEKGRIDIRDKSIDDKEAQTERVLKKIAEKRAKEKANV